VDSVVLTGTREVTFADAGAVYGEIEIGAAGSAYQWPLSWKGSPALGGSVRASRASLRGDFPIALELGGGRGRFSVGRITPLVSPNLKADAAPLRRGR